MARLEQSDEVNHKHTKGRINDKSTKFFVFVDYLFLFIFFVFLCFILFKLLLS